jgi:hypothetical protein
MNRIAPVSWWASRRYLLFFLSLLLLLLGGPFLLQGTGIQLGYVLLVALVILSGLWALELPRRRFGRLLLLALLVEGGNFLLLIDQAGQELSTVRFVILLVFFLFLEASLLRHLFRARAVNANLLYGAVSGYLLLGLIGGLGFHLLHSLQPEAFSVASALDGSQALTFIYFSLTTLSTLGYGDILPVTPVAQHLSVLLCIAGQLYLAILLALLVGKYLNPAQPSS